MLFACVSCFLHSQAKSTSGTGYLIKYAHVMLHLLETEAVDGILSMVFCGIITVNTPTRQLQPHPMPVLKAEVAAGSAPKLSNLHIPDRPPKVLAEEVVS